MRTLKDSIKDCIEDYMNESRLDEADLGMDPALNEIYQFFEENYMFTEHRGYSLVRMTVPRFKKFIKATKNGDKYVLDSSKSLRAGFSTTSFTNGLFEWGKIEGDFSCMDCRDLVSLEGAPKEIAGEFYCGFCSKLRSLEGAPEYVGRFDCNHCDSLTDLKGAPKKVIWDFDCSSCRRLGSLQGAPEFVGGDFNCDDCPYLRSLHGAPKEVVGDFNCQYCKSVRSLDGIGKVGGEIRSDL